MQISLEIYLHDMERDPIACVVCNAVPRMGELITLLLGEDKGSGTYRVQAIEHLFDPRRTSESLQHVCIVVNQHQTKRAAPSAPPKGPSPCPRCNGDVASHVNSVATDVGLWHSRCYHECADTKHDDDNGFARPMTDAEIVDHRKWAETAFGPLPPILPKRGA